MQSPPKLIIRHNNGNNERAGYPVAQREKQPSVISNRPRRKGRASCVGYPKRRKKGQSSFASRGNRPMASKRLDSVKKNTIKPPIERSEVTDSCTAEIKQRFKETGATLFMGVCCGMRFLSPGRQNRAIWPVKKAAKRCGRNNSHAKRGWPSREAARMENTKEGPCLLYTSRCV